MSDTKRLSVIVLVALWCLCSLPFANAEDFECWNTSIPSIRCGDTTSESVEVAANTIVVKKKGGVGAAAPACTNWSLTLWETFDTCTDGQTVTTCNLANWTETDASNLLTMESDFEKATLGCPGNVTDAGAVAMKLTPSGINTGYIYYDHADTNSVSYGMWIYVPTMGNFTGYTVLTIVGDPGDMITMAFKDEGGGTFCRVYSGSGQNSAVLATPAWYWVTIKYVRNTSTDTKIYNSSGTFVGNIADAGSPGDFAAKGLRVGLVTGISDTAVSYIDDVFVSTDATFPLGP